MVSHKLKKQREFVIANQDAKFFKGFSRGGKMVFTDIFNEAKTLTNIECVPTVQRYFPNDKIEVIYLETFK
jgi:hypothetical protein